MNGNIVLMGTRDGGISWTRVTSPGLAVTEAPVGFFAASNSSMVLEDADAGDIGNAWIGTGSAKTSAGKWVGPYLLNGAVACGMKDAPSYCGKDKGFHRQSPPIAGGNEAAGIFALGIRYDHGGVRKVVAVGGNYNTPANTSGTAAWALGGDSQWIAATEPPTVTVQPSRGMQPTKRGSPRVRMAVTIRSMMARLADTRCNRCQERLERHQPALVCGTKRADRETSIIATLSSDAEQQEKAYDLMTMTHQHLPSKDRQD